MTAPLDFEGAKQYALEHLERELSDKLRYHSLKHTRDEVLPAAERFAALEGIEGEDLLLLRIAALYHDIGFVKQRMEHEAVSAAIAIQVLPRFGYNAKQIEKTCGMIMATHLSQSSNTLLEHVIADADLDVLGREDFMTRNEDLRVEMAAYGTTTTDEEWYCRQLTFLQNHRYWTAAARSLRDDGKRRNIEVLGRLLQSYEKQM